MTIQIPGQSSTDKLMLNRSIDLDGQKYALEYAQSSELDGIGHVEISYGLQNREMLNTLRPFRAEFVRAMRWIPKDQPNSVEWKDQPDADYYDSLDTTLHLLASQWDSRKPIAGVRYTPVVSIEDSLSWSMFGDNMDMQDQAMRYVDSNGRNVFSDINQRARTTHSPVIWDMTRLVCERKKDTNRMEAAAAFMELFGSGYGVIKKHIRPDEYDDVRWVFTTTEEYKTHLQMLGIEMDILARGRISERDRDDSYFCVVEPQKNVMSINANPHLKDFTALYMNNGLEKANAL